MRALRSRSRPADFRPIRRPFLEAVDRPGVPPCSYRLAKIEREASIVRRQAPRRRPR